MTAEVTQGPASRPTLTRWRGFVVLLALSIHSAAAAAAPGQLEQPPYGILLMAHGGTDEWNQEIHNLVGSIDAGVPIEVAFGMADRATLEAAVHALERKGIRRIAIVRLFVSGESFLAQTEYLLGLNATVPSFLFDSSQRQGMRPVDDPHSVDPIEHHSEIAIFRKGLVDAEVSGQIMAERALRLSSDASRETVLVIAHGMGDEAADTRVAQALEARVDAIRDAAPFREVAAVTLREDWQEARVMAEVKIHDIVRRGSADGDVIVIPFRVAGFGPYAEVLDGLRYASDGTGLLPHSRIGDWVVHSGHVVACASAWIDASCSGPGPGVR